MALIVQKFGGSSLAGAERLQRAAERIADTYRRGHRVVAVLSARGNTTDDLLREARRIAPELPARESDLLLSVGEQIAVSHMAILLHHMGLPVEALTGRQAGVLTDRVFGDARILEVRTERILRALEDGRIVLVTGFQGITEDGEYEASFMVDVGNLPKAVAIEGHSILDGRPLIVFYNRSDMHITCVHYNVMAYDKDGQKLKLGKSARTFYGAYRDGIAPGESSDVIHITPSDTVREELYESTVTITGWETDSGYYAADGSLRNEYTINKLFPTDTCDIKDP